MFTTGMLSLSMCVTVYVINIHYRRPEMYRKMPDLIRKVFIHFLPKYLLMEINFELDKVKCKKIFSSSYYDHVLKQKQSENDSHFFSKSNINRLNLMDHAPSPLFLSSKCVENDMLSKRDANFARFVAQNIKSIELMTNNLMSKLENYRVSVKDIL